MLAYYFRIPIKEIGIDPDEESAAEEVGWVQTGAFNVPADSRGVSVAMLYAGIFAEQTFLGSSGADRCSSRGDLQKIAELYGYDLAASGEEGDNAIKATLELIDAVEPFLRDVFTRREAAFIRLAIALVKKNRLTGAEVAKIIHRHRHRRDRNRAPKALWSA